MRLIKLKARTGKDTPNAHAILNGRLALGGQCPPKKRLSPASRCPPRRPPRPGGGPEPPRHMPERGRRYIGGDEGRLELAERVSTLST